MSSLAMCSLPANNLAKSGALCFPAVPAESEASAPRPGPTPAEKLSVKGLRVLLSEENYKSSLGIVRHLGRMGVAVTLLARSRKSLVCRSRYCQEVILTRAETIDSLVEAALETVKQKRFDMIMPVSYAMTLALAQRRDRVPSHTHLELADSVTIELAANKVSMVELAKDAGVPVPRTSVATDAVRGDTELAFPVIIKPQRESPGHPPVLLARNFEELKSIFSGNGHSGPTRSITDALVQEFIPGIGCGFFATYQKGVCKRVFMHRRVREYPASGGVSTCAESFYDSKLEVYGRRMLDALQWHGVAMVEFRRDERDGEYKLMEVNPKFWGSIDLPLAAGADFPGDLCRMALGRSLSYTDTYRRNLRFHWPLSGHGDLYHLWTRPQSLIDVAFDLLNPRVKSNLRLDDLGPNLEEMRSLAAQVFRLGRR